MIKDGIEITKDKNGNMKDASGKDVEKYCFSTISQNKGNEIYAGVEFMRNFYTVFDLDHEVVGLAPLNVNDKVKALNKPI